MSKYAIIVAGGNGTRMQSQVPKQFLLLNGQPILYHTLKKFIQIPDIQIILVLPELEIQNWNQLIENHLSDIEKRQLNKYVKIVIGGNSRFQSVKNGLDSIIEENGTVAIHDGVRPLIATKKIIETFDLISKYDSVVLAVELKDSVRQISSDSNQIVDRATLRLIQTPQTFNLKKLKAAFKTPELSSFTDDASVMEHAGHPIYLHPGEYTNIKITTPEDLTIAEILLKLQ
jgi:2-C-methyl-D-erythritol 4-phosphate cytidylyltransferase